PRSEGDETHARGYRLVRHHGTYVHGASVDGNIRSRSRRPVGQYLCVHVDGSAHSEEDPCGTGGQLIPADGQGPRGDACGEIDLAGSAVAAAADVHGIHGNVAASSNAHEDAPEPFGADAMGIERLCDDHVSSARLDIDLPTLSVLSGDRDDLSLNGYVACGEQ